MKQLITLLLIFLLGSQLAFAQVSEKLEAFREKVLPKYITYFDKAELTENGHLYLSAVEKYTLQSVDGKKAIMDKINSAWQESLVLVHFGSKRELWGWSAQTEMSELLDEWDFNTPQLVIIPKTAPIPHPWFFYLGGIFGYDSQNNISMTINTRIGFFLLRDRWDFATTLSGGVSGNINFSILDGMNLLTWSNIGLMSRVYFPIREYKISPNIGAEMTFALSEASNTFNGALVLGINWYVGFGSVSIGFRIGNEFLSMGGYTVMPQIKNKRALR